MFALYFACSDTAIKRFYLLFHYIRLLLTHYRPAIRSETEKKLDHLFSSVLSKFKKYHSSVNLKFNNLGIFQSLKLRNLAGKTPGISLKLNLTPNTLGCYGFKKQEKKTKKF